MHIPPRLSAALAAAALAAGAGAAYAQGALDGTAATPPGQAPICTDRPVLRRRGGGLGVSKFLQLDAGLNFGLNRYTPGVNG